MKNLWVLMISILLGIPVLADDLHPVSQDQAIAQYQDFWKTETPDPMNHVVWKVYVYRAIPPSARPDSTPEYFIVGLTTLHEYYIRVNINQMYNFFHPLPQRGDVIVISGRIRDHRDYHTILPTKEVVIKTLTFDLDDANSLPNEHFTPAFAPGMTPGATPVQTPAVNPQGVH